MKIDKSFVGGLLGIMGFQAGVTLLGQYFKAEEMKNRPQGWRHEYSEEEVATLVTAVEKNDVTAFSRLYREKRPFANSSEVREKFSNFQRILREG